MALNLPRIGQRSAVVRYGVFVIGLILWYGLLWDPLWSKRAELATRIEAAQLHIERLNRDIQRHSDVDQKLAAEKQKYEQVRKNLFPGDDAQLVASKLQDLMLKRASEMNLNIVTYRTAPARKWREHQVAVVSFTINTDTRGIVQLLKSLEEDHRAFRIAQVNMVKLLGRTPVLRVTLEVEALVGEKG